MDKLTRLYLLLAFICCAPLAHAQPSETEKFNMLSCIPKAKPVKQTEEEVDKEWKWFSDAMDQEGEGSPVVKGPLMLRGACMKNVRTGPYYGAWFVGGEVCNEKLEDFVAAWRGIGIHLTRDEEPNSPPGSLSTNETLDTRAYQIRKTGGNAAYSFVCVMKSPYAQDDDDEDERPPAGK